MENPTFFMEAVVQGRDVLEDFEGPLTLLLHLLSQNKVEIDQIQIGDICDQYIAYLDRMKEMDLEVASAFVQMASHLVYIKARTILAKDEEIPELEQLINTMEELQCRAQLTQVRGVLGVLEVQLKLGGDYTEKPPEHLPDPFGGYEYQHSLVDILEALGRVFERDLDQPYTEGRRFIVPTPITYSVTEKAREIVARLKREGSMGIGDLFREARSRSEVVATLVAVLELCKLGGIQFSGQGADLAVCFTGQEVDTGAMEEMEQNGAT